MDQHKRVGMVGLGLMGSAIATNILAKGFPLTAMAHRNREPLEKLVALGATEAKTAAELARRSDVILVCVTGTAQARDALVRSEGLLDGLRPGVIVVESSTCDPEFAAEAEVAVRERGGHFLDAPVNRTPKEALEGRLNVLVGGEEGVLDQARPVLQAYSETIHHLGGIGSGYRAKLIHNFISQGNAVLLAEAFCTAAKAGVDLRAFADVCRLSGAHSRSFDRLIPYVLEGDASGQRFTIQNALKDMRGYTKLAEAMQSTAFAAQSVQQTYLLAANLGFGDKFVPHLFDALGAMNGVKVKAD